MTNPAQPFDPSKTLRARVAKCKRKRRELNDSWAVNVDYVRGKPFDSESDDDRVYVNVDASMGKRKAAQLASQLPEIRLSPKNERVKPIMAKFAKRVNDVMREACVGDAMFETTKDVVNASGFGVTLVGYEARTEDVPTPAVDPMTLSPEQQEAIAASGELDPEMSAELMTVYQIPMTTMPRVVSCRYYADRKSPSDFLWPLEFDRSNFDKAPWLGHSGRMSWADAKPAFSLKDEQKEDICGPRSVDEENLRNDTTSDNRSADEEDIVSYDELFYWRARFDPAEKQLNAIWRIVFIEGMDQPAVHEAWKGQKLLEKIGYVGAIKLPLRVVTLDYVPDDAIPQSDSAIARPQVNEMIRSRTQMITQRERSNPLRWHDVNRVDPLIATNLMKGTWNGSIPVKGNGTSIIGEVARASYPAENFEFDRIQKTDLHEAWQMDSNAMGMFARGRRTAAEANNVQTNFATQTGFARARIAAYVVGIAEVLAGLIVMFDNELPLPPDDPNQPPMDISQLSSSFDYSVLPDSTVLLDSTQLADQTMDTIDMLGKSGYVNPKGLIEKVLRLRGHDPAEILVDPEPKKDEPPNVSYRFSGVQDLTNPIVLAMLLQQNLGPTPEGLAAAYKVLEAAGGVVVAPPGMTPKLDEKIAQEQEQAQKKEQPPADARPEWTSMPSVSKRSDG